MLLSEFISNKESKYAIIRYDSYLQDPVAQSLSNSPRAFTYNDVTMVVFSLEPLSVEQLVMYANNAANGVEFELTLNSGKVTLLLHSQMLQLLQGLSDEEV